MICILTIANENCFEIPWQVCKKLTQVSDFKNWLEIINEYVSQVKPKNWKEILPFYFPY